MQKPLLVENTFALNQLASIDFLSHYSTQRQELLLLLRGWMEVVFNPYVQFAFKTRILVGGYMLYVTKITPCTAAATKIKTNTLNWISCFGYTAICCCSCYSIIYNNLVGCMILLFSRHALCYLCYDDDFESEVQQSAHKRLLRLIWWFNSGKEKLGTSFSITLYVNLNLLHRQ